MQFREQGKKIQCIRSSYDTEAKRSHQKLIATFDRYADKISSACVADLTDDERQELAVWFGHRQASRTAQLSQYRAATSAQTLTDLAAAIRTAKEMTDDQASAVWSGLADVAKALRKAGHPKPVSKREHPMPNASPRQADLLSDAVEPVRAIVQPVKIGG